MIVKGNKEAAGIFKGGKVATALYKGNRLGWEGVRSCFGKGMWVNGKPWRNADGWRN